MPTQLCPEIPSCQEQQGLGALGSRRQRGRARLVPLGQDAVGQGPLGSWGGYGEFSTRARASMVDFLATLKHKHVLLCLIETAQQMFYDYSTNGKRKKKRRLGSASTMSFMGGF